MTSAMDGVNFYVGRPLIEGIDRIKEFADFWRFTTNVMSPDSPKNIDRDYNRLNIHIDENSIIQRYTVG